MPPRSAEEKARRKVEFQKRKDARRLKKEQEQQELKANDGPQKSSTNVKTNDVCCLLRLDGDSLKQVCCFLSAQDLGRFSMSCRRIHQALPDLRVSFILARLNGCRAPLLGAVGSSINLCSNKQEAM